MVTKKSPTGIDMHGLALKIQSVQNKHKLTTEELCLTLLEHDSLPMTEGTIANARDIIFQNIAYRGQQEKPLFGYVKTPNGEKRVLLPKYDIR